MTEIAPDGSPVMLYARLPSLGEAKLINEAVPAGSESSAQARVASRMSCWR
ncbi:MAG: hypothetical protein M3Q59_01570 [Actinomycetota bacterium]|nr:hypothetical protein [Actinomycetota bacterium]